MRSNIIIWLGALLLLAGTIGATSDGASWRSGYRWDVWKLRVLSRPDVISFEWRGFASRSVHMYFWPFEVGYYYMRPECVRVWRDQTSPQKQWLAELDAACRSNFSAKWPNRTDT